MPCYHPSAVCVERKLRKKDSPGDPRRSDTVTVPCGSCLGCRTDQARQWAIRLTHQNQISRHAWFATLTYSDETIPSHGSLAPEDLPVFVRRLRSRAPHGLSYYICGEYGERTRRPHYHAILYGLDLSDGRRLAGRGGPPVWTHSALDRAWGRGITEYTSLTYEACMYVAGYVRKKVRKRDNPHHYTRVDPSTGELHELVPEFARMSRRPAIGREWIERYWSDVYPRDYVVANGIPMKPPRYYDKWMEDNQPGIMEEVRHQRYLDSEHIGDPKLIMKEKVHRARLGLFTKRDKI